jgi:Protein of unknown function (DUF3000)
MQARIGVAKPVSESDNTRVPDRLPAGGVTAGVPHSRDRRQRHTLVRVAPSTAVPAIFAHAVRGLRAAHPREEILLEEVSPPRRLAPYAYAVSASVPRGEEDIASGRLILLHDPAGHEAWEGTLRLVTFVTAELDAEMATDPFLPEVGWSWLIDALDHLGAHYKAVAGTVTQTLSTRFGDLAGQPPTADIEIRASWTPTDRDLEPHLEAWCALLASTAGLPPPGVVALPARFGQPGGGLAGGAG